MRQLINLKVRKGKFTNFVNYHNIYYYFLIYVNRNNVIFVILEEKENSLFISETKNNFF